MFRWLESWLTPCPRWLRDMGYLRETLNVRACREQCWFAWEPHLKKTKAIITSAMRRCEQRRKAVILGAGMLHDVPLAELSAGFREVVLVDILPSVEARKQQRKFPNVILHEADVTGTLEAVHRDAGTPNARLPAARPTWFADDKEVDLAASVNLLSQLPYLPVQYLRGKAVHAPEAIEAYARGVVAAHLDYLKRLPGVVALIADHEKHTIDRAGRTLQEETTIHGVPIPWNGSDWTWQLAPVMYLNRQHGYHLRVRGVVNVKELPPAPPEH